MFYTLFTVIGKRIHRPAIKDSVDLCFKMFHQLSTCPDLSHQHRSMLQVLIHLRENNWQQ